MSPGPDFTLVIRNALAGGFKLGFFTSLGIACAALLHVNYCLYGLTFLQHQSFPVGLIIPVIGGLYLNYLGYRSCSSATEKAKTYVCPQKSPPIKAFRQGFLCHLLNPKAVMFFLAILTTLFSTHTNSLMHVIYMAEVFIALLLWFGLLSWLVTRPRWFDILQTYQHHIQLALGVILILFGTSLIISALYLVL